MNLGNNADQMEEKINYIKDKNTEMTQMKDERQDIKKMKTKIYKNYLTPSKKAT